eukprot:gene6148-4427_t
MITIDIIIIFCRCHTIGTQVTFMDFSASHSNASSPEPTDAAKKNMSPKHEPHPRHSQAQMEEQERPAPVTVVALPSPLPMERNLSSESSSGTIEPAIAAQMNERTASVVPGEPARAAVIPLPPPAVVPQPSPEGDPHPRHSQAQMEEQERPAPVTVVALPSPLPMERNLSSESSSGTIEPAVAAQMNERTASVVPGEPARAAVIPLPPPAVVPQPSPEGDPHPRHSQAQMEEQERPAPVTVVALPSPLPMERNLSSESSSGTIEPAVAAQMNERTASPQLFHCHPPVVPQPSPEGDPHPRHSQAQMEEQERPAPVTVVALPSPLPMERNLSSESSSGAIEPAIAAQMNERTASVVPGEPARAAVIPLPPPAVVPQPPKVVVAESLEGASGGFQTERCGLLPILQTGRPPIQSKAEEVSKGDKEGRKSSDGVFCASLLKESSMVSLYAAVAQRTNASSLEKGGELKYVAPVVQQHDYKRSDIAETVKRTRYQWEVPSSAAVKVRWFQNDLLVALEPRARVLTTFLNAGDLNLSLDFLHPKETERCISMKDFIDAPFAFDSIFLAISVALWGSVAFANDLLVAIAKESGVNDPKVLKETEFVVSVLGLFAWLNEKGFDVLVTTPGRSAARFFGSKRSYVERRNRLDALDNCSLKAVSGAAPYSQRVLVVLIYDSKHEVWSPATIRRHIRVVTATHHQLRREEKREQDVLEREAKEKAKLARRRHRERRRKKRWDQKIKELEANNNVEIKEENTGSVSRSISLFDTKKSKEQAIVAKPAAVAMESSVLSQEGPFDSMLYPNLEQTDFGVRAVVSRILHPWFLPVRVRLFAGIPLCIISIVIGVALVCVLEKETMSCITLDGNPQCVAESEINNAAPPHVTAACINSMYHSSFASSVPHRFLFGPVLGVGRTIVGSVCCAFVTLITGFATVFFALRAYAVASRRKGFLVIFHVINIGLGLVSVVLAIGGVVHVVQMRRSSRVSSCSWLQPLDKKNCYLQLSSCPMFERRVYDPKASGWAEILLASFFLFFSFLHCVTLCIPLRPRKHADKMKSAIPDTYTFRPSPFAPDGLSPDQQNQVRYSLYGVLQQNLDDQNQEMNRLVSKNKMVAEMMLTYHEHSRVKETKAWRRKNREAPRAHGGGSRKLFYHRELRRSPAIGSMPAISPELEDRVDAVVDQLALREGSNAITFMAALGPIKVDQIQLVAHWTWDTKESDCGICKCSLEACCMGCVVPGDECPISTGRCSHTFHLHCIEAALRKNDACPLPTCQLGAVVHQKKYLRSWPLLFLKIIQSPSALDEALAPFTARDRGTETPFLIDATTCCAATSAMRRSEKRCWIDAFNPLRITIVSHLHTDFKPSASSAPHLLESYVEPKPFVSQKNLQIFTVFFLVGGATVCAVYFLLSSSIAEDLGREYTHADGIRESNERHAALLEEFAVHTSYKHLHEKMERRNAEAREQQLTRVSVLHSEVLYRAKMWWNRQLTLIDSVVTLLWERRKLQSEYETIRSALSLKGYDLHCGVSLPQQHVVALDSLVHGDASPRCHCVGDNESDLNADRALHRGARGTLDTVNSFHDKKGAAMRLIKRIQAYFAKYFKLKDSFVFYGAYHHEKRNKLVHIIGVPIIFSTALGLASKCRVTAHVNLSHAAAALYGVSFIVMEPLAGVLYLPLIAAMQQAGSALAHKNLSLCGGLQLLGWTSQILAHKFFEGQQPAFMDDPLQAIHSAVFFVWLEVLFALGYRKKDSAELESLIEARMKQLTSKFIGCDNILPPGACMNEEAHAQQHGTLHQIDFFLPPVTCVLHPIFPRSRQESYRLVAMEDVWMVILPTSSETIFLTLECLRPTPSSVGDGIDLSRAALAPVASDDAAGSFVESVLSSSTTSSDRLKASLVTLDSAQPVIWSAAVAPVSSFKPDGVPSSSYCSMLDDLLRGETDNIERRKVEVRTVADSPGRLAYEANLKVFLEEMEGSSMTVVAFQFTLDSPHDSSALQRQMQLWHKIAMHLSRSHLAARFAAQQWANVRALREDLVRTGYRNMAEEESLLLSVQQVLNSKKAKIRALTAQLLQSKDPSESTESTTLRKRNRSPDRSRSRSEESTSSSTESALVPRVSEPRHCGPAPCGPTVGTSREDDNIKLEFLLLFVKGAAEWRSAIDARGDTQILPLVIVWSMTDKKAVRAAPYGDATDLPGVPNQFCVCSVVYEPHVAGGVSATITASTQEVHLMGPNRDKPTELTCRQLWRPVPSAHLVPNSGGASDSYGMAHIVALDAFLLHTPCALQEGSDAHHRDAVCVFVVWEDTAGVHHVALCVFSLLAALSPSRGAEVILFKGDAFELPLQRRALRVFHYPTHLIPDTTVGNSERDDKLPNASRHIALVSTCPSLVPASKDTLPEIDNSFIFLSVECSTAATAPSLDGSARPLVRQPLDASVFLVVRRIEEAGAPLSQALGASGHPISCMEFFDWSPYTKEAAAAVHGAAGSIDGRVFVLEGSASRLVRRVSGPVGDVKFVVPYCDSSALVESRSKFSAAPIDELISTKLSIRSGSRKSESGTGVLVDLTLVVLDTAGKIIVLRRVNTRSMAVQVVCDVIGKPHMVTMRGEEILPTDVAGSAEGNRCDGIAGHILSSGLLHAAVRQHPLCLTVSTMGQAIVVIPFHEAKDCFSISSCTICPTPVFYVGVVDHFRRGAEDLVIAGPDSVLIARQPQPSLERKASTLLELLQYYRKDVIAPNSTGDEAVGCTS